MSNFIVSCENSQELTDILHLCNGLRKNNFRPLYFDMSPMLGRTSFHEENDSRFFKIINSKPLAKGDFKLFSPFLKAWVSFVNALILIIIYYRNNADFLLIGSPLLTYRLTRILTFGNIKVISLIRGAVVYSDKETSLSSKLFINMGALGRSKILRSIFSDYYSHLVFCIGQTTKNFLISRAVPASNIRVSGSLYCDNLIVKERSFSDGGMSVVFFSSAFAFHGYVDAQQAQTKFIRTLKEISLSYGCDFLIRKHPREDITIYENEPDLIQCVDSTSQDPLTGYSSTALFLSIVSTLVFEMSYVGRTSRIISDDFFMKRFSDWYRNVCVNPIVNIDDLIKQYANRKELPRQDLSNAISLEKRGRVVDYCCEEILTFVNKRY